LFEQWLVLVYLRAVDYANTEARLLYWRTNSGAEVNFFSTVRSASPWE
jgi:hypothetical protein